MSVTSRTDSSSDALLALARVVMAATVRAGNARTPPLPPTQIRTLSLLETDPDGLSLTTVAAGLGTTASAASRLCSRLVRDGLVVRSSGPGTEIRLSLSEAGRRVLDELNEARLALLRPLLERVPERSRAATVTALRQLADAAAAAGELW